MLTFSLDAQGKKYQQEIWNTKINGSLIILKAIHYCPTKKKFKPHISNKDGVVNNTSLVNELLLKLGVKVMLIHNIDTQDMLTMDKQDGAASESSSSRPGIIRIFSFS